MSINELAGLYVKHKNAVVTVQHRYTEQIENMLPDQLRALHVYENDSGTVVSAKTSASQR